MTLTEQVEKLKKYNFKITPQRLRVIEYINESPGHFTAEDVYKSVVKVEPSITVATVYNILRAVTMSGILTSFEVNGTTWYETNLEKHANFVCLSCGSIEDFEIECNDLSKSAEAKGYKVNNVDVIIRGYCKECLSKGLVPEITN